MTDSLPKSESSSEETRAIPVPGRSASGHFRPAAFLEALKEAEAAKAAEPAALGPRRIAGRYEILSTLGEGGMGVVYRALDHELGREVAVKTIQPAKRDEKRVARFLREARLLARFRHKGCVQVHDIGKDAGLEFFVMELVTGQPLDELVRTESISPHRAALIIFEIAGALECVHAAGVVHRDVKPQNVIVGAEGAKLCDFGLARSEGDAHRITAKGALVGTLSYMPPEQARKDDSAVDARTDVYSLGATLYHAVTKVPPFAGPTTLVLAGIENVEPPTPRRLNPEVPPDLERIILKCLAKRKEDRYASMGELRADLGRFLAGEPVRCRSWTLEEKLAAFARRRPDVVRVLIFAALLVVLAIAVVRASDRISTSSNVAKLVARAETLLAAHDYKGAEESFAAAAGIDPALGPRELEARAEKFLAEGDDEVATFVRELEGVRARERARDELIARWDGELPEAPFSSSIEKQSVQSARCELATLDECMSERRLAAQRAFAGALAVTPSTDVAARVVRGLATIHDALVDRDPKTAELVAHEAAALASAHGLPPLDPATLAVRSVPAGALVRLYRCEYDVRLGIERAVPFNPRCGEDGCELGKAPLVAALPAGEYVAVVDSVRVPFRAARRTRVELSVPTAIPEDFAYVGSASGTSIVALMRRPVTAALWRELTNEPATVAHLPAFVAAFSKRVAGFSLGLPTPEEVRRAVHGPLHRAFPWGDSFDPAFVGGREDLSPSGIHGLAEGVLVETKQGIRLMGGTTDEALLRARLAAPGPVVALDTAIGHTFRLVARRP